MPIVTFGAVLEWSVRGANSILPTQSILKRKPISFIQSGIIALEIGLIIMLTILLVTLSHMEDIYDHMDFTAQPLKSCTAVTTPLM
jgi:hypothetical protein